jgi:hypothetical protein
MTQYGYFVILGIIQLIHSQEEIWTGFHKRWFVFTMPRWVFIAFEVLFSIPILLFMANPNLNLAKIYMPIFALLMLINGLGHMVWGLVERKYVPGLITAPLFVLIFIFYYVDLISQAW